MDAWTVIIVLWVVATVSLIGMLVYVYNMHKPEHFATSSSGTVVAFTTNPLQHLTWAKAKKIRIQPLAYDRTTWDAPAALTVATARGKQLGPNVCVIADPLDAATSYATRAVVGQAPKGYFVAIYGLEQALKVECSIDLANKRIGFLDRTDFLFIQALVQGYRMQSPKELRQIPLDQWTDLEKQLVTGTLDVIVTFVIPNSDLYRLLQAQTLSLVGFRNLDIDRVRLFYPFVALEKVKLTDIFPDVPGSGLQFMAKEKDTMVPSMSMPIVLIQGTYMEAFEGTMHPHNISADPGYRCYGDDTVESKVMCNSPYDVIGMPKPFQTVWDKPCVTDADCPFYRSNTNYTNDRGGCLKDGICEMPVGVKRIAYRMYDATGVNAPFCYGCSDGKDPLCCAGQTRPDYAFTNDREARTKQGMESIIAMK